MGQSDEAFEIMLTGGHPNSLGRTTEVVKKILENPELLENLYQCYFSRDEVVRLRTSNAFKRVAAAHLEPQTHHSAHSEYGTSTSRTKTQKATAQKEKVDVWTDWQDNDRTWAT
jgi:hypothetical protein